MTTTKAARCTARSHGTLHAYKRHKCTCPGIERISYLQEKRQKAGLISPRVTDARGTRRWVQAMALMGHTLPQIAAAAGCASRTLERLFKGQATVTVEVAAAIRSIEWMAVTPARPSRNATYARRSAEKHGWWPPDFWDDIDHDPEPEPVEDEVDEVAVMHAIAGDMHWKHLGPAEKRLVVAALDRCGYGLTRMVAQLRATEKSVWNVLDEIRNGPRDRRRRRAS